MCWQYYVPPVQLVRVTAALDEDKDRRKKIVTLTSARTSKRLQNYLVCEIQGAHIEKKRTLLCCILGKEQLMKETAVECLSLFVCPDHLFVFCFLNVLLVCIGVFILSFSSFCGFSKCVDTIPDISGWRWEISYYRPSSIYI